MKSTAFQNYMLWLAPLNDGLKLELAIALLESVRSNSRSLVIDGGERPSSFGKWEGESAEELIDMVYGARNNKSTHE